MSDTTGTTVEETADPPKTGPAEGTVEQPGSTETGTEGSPQEGAAENAGTESTLSHEDALKELTRVRQEAATRRTENRDLKAQLAAAKTPEEFTAVQEKVVALERAQTLRDIADEAGLPSDLRDALKGDTEDELKAHAEILKKYVPAAQRIAPPVEDLKGGLTPGQIADGDDDLDPGSLANKLRRRRLI